MSSIAVLGWAAMWWLSVPRASGVCIAIYPAPRGCAEGRIGTAALWSGVLAALLAAAIGVSMSALRRRTVVLATALIVILVAAVAGYRAVLYT